MQVVEQQIARPAHPNSWPTGSTAGEKPPPREPVGQYNKKVQDTGTARDAPLLRLGLHRHPGDTLSRAAKAGVRPQGAVPVP